MGTTRTRRQRRESTRNTSSIATVQLLLSVESGNVHDTTGVEIFNNRAPNASEKPIFVKKGARYPVLLMGLRHKLRIDRTDLY